jgi:hypothetical protein
MSLSERSSSFGNTSRGNHASSRGAGVSRVTWEAKAGRSVIKAFVNQGTVPQAATIAKLEAALGRLQSA